MDEQEKRFTFRFDAYLNIQADSEEEARSKIREAEEAIESLGHGLAIFDAYGIEDNKTGEEIRPVD